MNRVVQVVKQRGHHPGTNRDLGYLTSWKSQSILPRRHKRQLIHQGCIMVYISMTVTQEIML